MQDAKPLGSCPVPWSTVSESWKLKRCNSPSRQEICPAATDSSLDMERSKRVLITGALSWCERHRGELHSGRACPAGGCSQSGSLAGLSFFFFSSDVNYKINEKNFGSRPQVGWLLCNADSVREAHAGPRMKKKILRTPREQRDKPNSDGCKSA